MGGVSCLLFAAFPSCPCGREGSELPGWWCPGQWCSGQVLGRAGRSAGRI